MDILSNPAVMIVPFANWISLGVVALSTLAGGGGHLRATPQIRARGAR
jgi:hypothetical protein